MSPPLQIAPETSDDEAIRSIADVRAPLKAWTASSRPTPRVAARGCRALRERHAGRADSPVRRCESASTRVINIRFAELQKEITHHRRRRHPFGRRCGGENSDSGATLVADLHGG